MIIAYVYPWRWFRWKKTYTDPLNFKISQYYAETVMATQMLSFCFTQVSNFVFVHGNYYRPQNDWCLLFLGGRVEQIVDKLEARIWDKRKKVEEYFRQDVSTIRWRRQRPDKCALSRSRVLEMMCSGMWQKAWLCSDKGSSLLSCILLPLMATHSSIPACRIPWTGELGWLQSMESQRVKQLSKHHW